MPHPRAVAHCILRREGKVLLIRIIDPVTGATGWRAPGGGIEWLESAEDAVRREIREELGLELREVRLRGVVEGFIQWRGAEEHEIVFLFEGWPVGWDKFAEGDSFEAVEANGRPIDLRWVVPEELYGAGEVLYPSASWPHFVGHITGRVRPVALCALERNGAYLAFDLRDAVNQRDLVRFPGGGIEYGERAEEALRRELHEELDTELEDVKLLGVLENIFGFPGEPGHETVFLFSARATNRAVYASETNVAVEAHERVPLRWVPLTELTAGVTTLVPEGALELLV